MKTKTKPKTATAQNTSSSSPGTFLNLPSLLFKIQIVLPDHQ